jgi:signal transduction histidine kinase
MVSWRYAVTRYGVDAIEAMKDSGGELTVKSELQGGQLQFSVSDRGVGLPMEKIGQIFSAFFTNKPQGSGMGLSISRSIVESHDGRLWATSNKGPGATFHFTLPTPCDGVSIGHIKCFSEFDHEAGHDNISETKKRG